MLVVMNQGASDAQVNGVIQKLETLKFKVNRVDGVIHTVLAGVGPADNLDPAEFEVLPGVKECHLIVSPYKLAAKAFRPEGTVIKVGKVAIGGSEVISMGGPCSVESASQIEKAAAIV